MNLEDIEQSAERLRCEVVAQLRKLVWVAEPITRHPFDPQAARDAAARAAWNDGDQDLYRVLG